MIRAFLVRQWPMLAFASVVSTAGPIISLLVLSNINELAGGDPSGNNLRRFVAGLGWLLALLMVDSAAQFLLARLGAKFVAQLRVDISKRFIDVSYESLLNRAHVVSDALVGDIWRIAPLVLEGPLVLYNALFALLCSAYLAVISPALAAILFVFFGAMILVFVIIEKSAGATFDDMRRVEDVLGGHYRSISEGKKELSLNADRAGHFIRDVLLPGIRRAEVLMVKVHLRWGLNQAWSVTGLYAAILTVIYFGEGALDLPNSVLISFVIGAFFLIGPINFVLRSGLTVSRAMSSLHHLEGLGLDIQSKINADAIPDDRRETVVWADWREIRFEGLCYQYPNALETDRMLGPFDLNIKRGELIFIVGENGSGKSTLLLLLCGLLTPRAGRLLIDRHPIDGTARCYRSRFAGVFGDCHLFADVLDLTGGHVSDRDVECLLRRVGLDSRVSVAEGRLSTLALSTGQQKRLALAQCYAEDREINFFDEWAADQDPEFREYFYLTLLPDLKRRGKTVLVISHDDRYFHIADRVIKLEAGRVVSNLAEKPSVGLAVSPAASE
jgi:cyclic peptide transporter